MRKEKQNLGSGNSFKKATIEGKRREQRLARGGCRIRGKGSWFGYEDGRSMCRDQEKRT